MDAKAPPLPMHEEHGGVLMSLEDPGAKVRKYYMCPAVLMRMWTHEHQDDVDVNDKESAHRLKLTALRNAHRETRRELRAAQARLEGRQLRLAGRDAA